MYLEGGRGGAYGKRGLAEQANFTAVHERQAINWVVHSTIKAMSCVTGFLRLQVWTALPKQVGPRLDCHIHYHSTQCIHKLHLLVM